VVQQVTQQSGRGEVTPPVRSTRLASGECGQAPAVSTGRSASTIRHGGTRSHGPRQLGVARPLHVMNRAGSAARSGWRGQRPTRHRRSGHHARRTCFAIIRATSANRRPDSDAKKASVRRRAPRRLCNPAGSSGVFPRRGDSVDVVRHQNAGTRRRLASRKHSPSYFAKRRRPSPWVPRRTTSSTPVPPSSSES